mgnify:CR=1 FL=1
MDFLLFIFAADFLIILFYIIEIVKYEKRK